MSRRRFVMTAVVLSAGLALAGCTPPVAEPTAWQGVVQTLASQASGGDYAAASATLDQLEADVTAQRDAGTLPAAEAEAILARIAAVRADLVSLVPAPEPTTETTPEPAPDAPAPTTVDDDGADDEEQQTPGESDEEGPGNSDNGKDNKGKSDQSKGPGEKGKKDG